VFCRNVLIYFDAPTQERAIRQRLAQVATGGVLFLGSAETFLARGLALRPIGKAMSFAFRKVPAAAQPAVATPKPPRIAPKPILPKPQHRPAMAAAIPNRGITPPPAAKAPAPDLLIEAEALANAGKLTEAAELCRAYVSAKGPNARAYFLLGVAADATGHPGEAVNFFRKAIYLEPRHEQALLHLALLTGKRGASDQARQLHKRARSVDGSERGKIAS
jgi:chemotaxis protein methyltransferase WspC